MKFALIGAAGYIAPRHIKAIKDTGNEIVAMLDKSDSVGIIDSYFPNAKLFTESERFDRHLYRNKVDYVSICSPNYLHDAHIRMALRNGADVICEKPITINPHNIEALQEIEIETGGKVNCILQLRLHPSIVELKKNLSPYHHQVKIDYITPRGEWYLRSWKGDIEKSGGLPMNIGVHFFDLLCYLFGEFQGSGSTKLSGKTCSGRLQFSKATVDYKLSIDANNLPKGKTTHRVMNVDGFDVDFSSGFTNLHTESYERILAGAGFGLDIAKQSIEIVNSLKV